MDEVVGAVDVDPEIGVTVAIDGALDEDVAAFTHDVQLAGPVVEGLRPDEAERLIPHHARVGVDAGEIDLVVLKVMEVHDLVRRTQPTVLRGGEAERIGAGTAKSLSRP